MQNPNIWPVLIACQHAHASERRVYTFNTSVRRCIGKEHFSTKKGSGLQVHRARADRVGAEVAWGRAVQRVASAAGSYS